MINIFNRLIFDVKYFNSWKKDDFALLSSQATFHLSPFTQLPSSRRNRASGQLGGLVTP